MRPSSHAAARPALGTAAAPSHIRYRGSHLGKNFSLNGRRLDIWNQRFPSRIACARSRSRRFRGARSSRPKVAKFNEICSMPRARRSSTDELTRYSVRPFGCPGRGA